MIDESRIGGNPEDAQRQLDEAIARSDASQAFSLLTRGSIQRNTENINRIAILATDSKDAGLSTSLLLYKEVEEEIRERLVQNVVDGKNPFLAMHTLQHAAKLLDSQEIRLTRMLRESGDYEEWLDMYVNDNFYIPRKGFKEPPTREQIESFRREQARTSRRTFLKRSGAAAAGLGAAAAGFLGGTYLAEQRRGEAVEYWIRQLRTAESQTNKLGSQLLDVTRNLETAREERDSLLTEKSRLEVEISVMRRVIRDLLDTIRRYREHDMPMPRRPKDA